MGRCIGEEEAEEVRRGGGGGGGGGPPLFSWKGYMQSWSVGCRAPTLCKLFVNIKTKNYLGKQAKASDRSIQMGKRKKYHNGSSNTTISWRSSSPKGEQVVVGGMMRNAAGESAKRWSGEGFRVERAGAGAAAADGGRRRSFHGVVTTVGEELVVRGGNLRAEVGRRHSTSSTSYYERLGRGGAGAGAGAGGEVADLMMLARKKKLGRGEAEEEEKEKEGEERRHSHSHSNTNTTNTNNTNTTTRKLLQMKRAALLVSGAAEPPLMMRQLLAGNQFLTHVTAAPVPLAEGGSSDVMPSGGFVDASRRASREQFKDRLVFFL